jgi:hypothetical protein
MNIIDLQEISPNVWKAKYRGNYGVYTIKVKTDGKKTVDFSCSCPSSYYPCKHIPMIEEAISERIAKSKKNVSKQEIQIEQLLQNAPQKELCDFIVRQAQYNPQFKNNVLLEFAHKAKKSVKNYNQLLKDALEDLYYDDEDVDYGHYEGTIEIDVIDQWLDKAQKFADQNNPAEALSICKACIEEFAEWCVGQEDYIVEYFDYSYQERPFEIINQVYTMQGIDNNALLEYCKAEMMKPKYDETELYDGFSDLLMKLSVAVGSDDFIALQDKLFRQITDKSSYEAEKLLNQKIEFYLNNNQPEKADEIVRKNLQIESFRKKLATEYIADNKLKEAKKLINDYLSAKGNENKYLGEWYNLKLQIAQKENDIPEIRHISYQYIESRYNAEYYSIYKSTFTKEEWPVKMEQLIDQYEKKSDYKLFRTSVADILQVEKQEERLMKYVEKHLTVENLENYYTCFSSAFPAQTLVLFRKVIDKYAQNTGRDIYEHIARLFKKMAAIEGGIPLVKEMISQYRTLYKNRRAMMEILNTIKI